MHIGNEAIERQLCLAGYLPIEFFIVTCGSIQQHKLCRPVACCICFKMKFIEEKIIKEIRRLVRYHDEHYGQERPIQQVVTLGGGANIPGLSDYFTSSLRMAVRTLDPWQKIDINGLQPPELHDRPMFASVIGLGIVPPGEVFK